MKIVSVIARKGGTGKSTCCRSLAVEGLKAGQRTVILDGDPQASTLRWAERRKARGIEVPIVASLSADMPISALLSHYDQRGVNLLLIDTPPVLTPVINRALEYSTGIVVVVRPNPEDLESVADTLKLAAVYRRPQGVVLWQVSPDKRVRATALAREFLTSAGAGTAPTAVASSVIYPYAYARGMTVQELEPASRARTEIAAVWGWLQEQSIV